MSHHQSLSRGCRYGMPKRLKTSFSVGVVSGMPPCTFRLPRRTTFSFSECSDRLMFLVLARALIERLKCAEPVKYKREQANSL